jgi:hypothetical protein
VQKRICAHARTFLSVPVSDMTFWQLRQQLHDMERPPNVALNNVYT